MGYTPTVLVIGGGATGTAVARDLALRGLDVTLVDRGSLASGGSGRMQGLVYSGARFASADAALAADCYAENLVVRDIAPHCVNETGGLYARLPEDDADAIDHRRRSCAAAGIPTALLTADQVQRLEPRVASAVEEGLFVPDATIDPYRFVGAVGLDAQTNDATIETEVGVEEITTSDGAVSEVHLSTADGAATVSPDYVVTATGAWTNQILDTVNCSLPVTVSRGGMVVVDGSPTEAVLHRCHSGEDQHSLVPSGYRSVLGVTDESLADPPESGGDPDDSVSEHAHVEPLIESLTAVVPELPDSRRIDTVWGTRAIPSAAAAVGPGASLRPGEVLIVDHEERDGLWGLTSVVGGTLTTARLIAERVADQVCAKFGIDRECETATRPLPGREDPEHLGEAMSAFGLDVRS